MADAAIQARQVELKRRIQALEVGQQSQGPAPVAKQQSLREFLNEKRPITANERGLCIAYYYEATMSYECFNAKDIEAGFRGARSPAPKNPNGVTNKNIAKTHMTDARHSKDGRKAWFLPVPAWRPLRRVLARRVNGLYPLP